MSARNDSAGSAGLEVAFTTGEWIVNPFNAQVDCGKPSRHGGLLPVCQMLWPTDERSEAETEANARLIAEAPALYEILEAILRNSYVGQAHTTVSTRSKYANYPAHLYHKAAAALSRAGKSS